MIMKLSPSNIVQILAVIYCSLNLVDSYNLDKLKTAFIRHYEHRKIRNIGKSALVRPDGNTTPSPPSTLSTYTPEPIEKSTTASEKHSTTSSTTVKPTAAAEGPPLTTTLKAVFEEDTPTSPKVCKSKEYYDTETRECYALATKGPCKSKQWYIINKKSGKATCETRPCPPFYAKYKEKCIISSNAEKEGICKRGEQLYHDIYGDYSCGCHPLHYRWSEDEFCYPLYYRGPCQRQQHFIYNEETNTTECVANECIEGDGFVKVNGQCAQLGDVCGKNGEKNIYINPHTEKPGCYDFFRPATE